MNHVNTAGIILASTAAGYCLQPVPEKINTLFDESNEFKFMVLVGTGIFATKPQNIMELCIIMIIVIMILVALDYLRETEKPVIKEKYRVRSSIMG